MESIDLFGPSIIPRQAPVEQKLDLEENELWAHLADQDPKTCWVQFAHCSDLASEKKNFGQPQQLPHHDKCLLFCPSLSTTTQTVQFCTIWPPVTIDTWPCSSTRTKTLLSWADKESLVFDIDLWQMHCSTRADSSRLLKASRALWRTMAAQVFPLFQLQFHSVRFFQSPVFDFSIRWGQEIPDNRVLEDSNRIRNKNFTRIVARLLLLLDSNVETIWERGSFRSQRILFLVVPWTFVAHRYKYAEKKHRWGIVRFWILEYGRSDLQQLKMSTWKWHSSFSFRQEDSWWTMDGKHAGIWKETEKDVLRQEENEVVFSFGCQRSNQVEKVWSKNRSNLEMLNLQMSNWTFEIGIITEANAWSFIRCHISVGAVHWLGGSFYGSASPSITQLGAIHVRSQRGNTWIRWSTQISMRKHIRILRKRFESVGSDWVRCSSCSSPNRATYVLISLLAHAVLHILCCEVTFTREGTHHRGAQKWLILLAAGPGEHQCCHSGASPHPIATQLEIPAVIPPSIHTGLWAPNTFVLF